MINCGRPLEGFYYDDPIRRGRRLKIIHRGETYIANCPACHDTRMRLSVNHRCGVYDPEVRIEREDGTPYDWHGWELWKCYNEECQKDPVRKKDVRKALEDLNWRGPVLRVPPPKAVSKPVLDPVEFPGILVPISELPDDHPAVAYLIGRKFDPKALAEDWEIGYAVHVPPRIRGSSSMGRIIIPMRLAGSMVGWQARYPGDLDWKAAGISKYMTFFPKSLMVYAIDEAEAEDIVVLVEGVTDVWRYGKGAVCGLGKGLSPDQVDLLCSRLRGRPLVLIPDANDPQSEGVFIQTARDLVAKGYNGRISLAPLKVGTDPADMDTGKLRGLVRASVAASAKA